ncbi:HK97 gp10 family phage protein [Solibacillus sp. MA9]|uniref:HK97 gp10 family phage protein n=1 Tax=Solibacillus palustris TaxID=2908203 RepID=A0ABS9UCB7_9BACL|nr:HK97 gp10 family phage protein [Solibacillus sp. MA9]MCH7321780.1 HK97 gp10 family phage protein [Solibacillus sp. MA9]
MARRGARVDFRELKRMKKKIERLGHDYEKFLEAMTKEIAARLLRKVKLRTPVGVYDKPVNFTTNDGKQVSFTPSTGMTGGTLRNAWTVDTTVKKVGSSYQIEVFNPTEYAMWVEFGHRTANHQGWVNGKFMMTISADEVERAAPSIIDKKLTRMLKEAFDGN